MLKIGTLPLDGTPRIAVGFNDRITSHDVEEACQGGLDIAEVRIDQFRSFDQDYVIQKLSLFQGSLPVLATIRVKDEGGSWTGSEDERRELFDAIIPYVDAIDIELRMLSGLRGTVERIKATGKLLVVSFHDCEATPDLPTLKNIVRDAKKQGADIVKIATTVNANDDTRLLASLLVEEAAQNLIVIGMGTKGLITRLLFPGLGSLATFAFVGEKTAPGQLPYVDMVDLLRLIYPAFNDAKIVSLKLMECV